jgi:hypothetical protein
MGANINASITYEDGERHRDPPNPPSHIRKCNRRQSESDRGMTRYLAVAGRWRITKHEVVEQFSGSTPWNELFDCLGKNPNE